jgi:hypothetical protein
MGEEFHADDGVSGVTRFRFTPRSRSSRGVEASSVRMATGVWIVLIETSLSEIPKLGSLNGLEYLLL